MKSKNQIKKLFEIENVSFSYSDELPNVLEGFYGYIEEGKITTIIGPNGSGKSTLLHLLTCENKNYTGSISLSGMPISSIKLRDFAKKVAVVHQKNIAPLDITVKDIVSYGRIPYKNFMMNNLNDYDYKTIDKAIEITGLKSYENSMVSNLSGGQQQRVWIAMALAQDTDILFLDEPTTYLDIKYQLDILKLVKNLNKRYGITVVMVLHDINQAIRYSDNIIAMNNGHLAAIGAPEKIITENLIKDVYQLDDVKLTTIDQMPYVITY